MYTNRCFPPSLSASAGCETWRSLGSQGCNTSTQSAGSLSTTHNNSNQTDDMHARQKYSHYLPLYQTLSRTTSRAGSFSKDGTRSPKGSKSGRLSSSLQSAKRRSTMNSRDAAYKEEEELRRAIEASKNEMAVESTDGGTRRGKRGRSESEEYVSGSLVFL